MAHDGGNIGDGIVGVVLAGGRSRRFEGGDKTAAKLNGKPLIEHVAEILRPQVRLCLLNTVAEAVAPAFSGWPVVRDSVKGHAGPLAGILAALDWTRANLPGVQWVVSSPADTPFLPADLVRRLVGQAERDQRDMACAVSGGRDHPTAALWPVALADPLRAALVYENVRAVHAWAARYRLARASWPATPIDPFFNINTREDLERAEKLLS